MIGLFILVGVIFSFFMSQRDAYFQNIADERGRTDVGVYQTSQTYYSEDRLSDMRPEDYQARGLSFPLWSFAFTSDHPSSSSSSSVAACSGIDSMSDLAVEGVTCGEGLTPDVPQAMISIDTSKKYQVERRRRRRRRRLLDAV